MNEARKQQLEDLLDKAMSSLEIQFIDQRVDNNSSTILLPIDQYKRCLQERWTSYSDHVLPIVRRFSPEIIDEETKQDLLQFIRQEFAPFIRDDRILTASSKLVSNPRGGFPLTRLLEQLLNTAIVRGVKPAVSAFISSSSSSQETRCTYQVIALLEGLELTEDIQLYEGIRLCSNSESEFVRYLSNSDLNNLRGKTLLIIDCFTSPLFSKPPPLEASQEHPKKMEGRWWEGVRFRLDVNTENPPKIKGVDFNETLFCQALSLACNSPIRIGLKSRFLAEDELFNLSDASSILTSGYGVSRNFTEAGKTEIDKAKSLYEVLALNSEVRERLQIPIDRWLRSKISSEAPTEYVDAMIDLGIAFESIYLSNIEDSKQELRFRLRLHVALYLGKDEDDRRRLMKEVRDIYDWRSKAVHKGRLPKRTTNEKAADFVAKAQDLCRDSILKIVEDGKFPDWGELILGE